MRTFRLMSDPSAIMPANDDIAVLTLHEVRRFAVHHVGETEIAARLEQACCLVAFRIQRLLTRCHQRLVFVVKLRVLHSECREDHQTLLLALRRLRQVEAHFYRDASPAWVGRRLRMDLDALAKSAHHGCCPVVLLLVDQQFDRLIAGTCRKGNHTAPAP